MFILQEARFLFSFRYTMHKKWRWKFQSLLEERRYTLKFIVYFNVYCIVRWKKHAMYCIVYFVFYASSK